MDYNLEPAFNVESRLLIVPHARAIQHALYVILDTKVFRQLHANVVLP
jgi:hypothetical protein